MIETIYSDPNFLQHYGVKGMKWGVRKEDSSNKKHLGITEKGTIGLVYGKSSNKAKARFALNTTVLAASMYVAAHPEIASKMINKSLKTTKVSSINSLGTDSNIWSKKLNRYLTLDEVDNVFSTKPWQETAELYNFKTGKTDKISYAKYAKDSFGHSDELYHYGVKGMKWGVRKEEKPTGRTRKGLSSSTKRKLAIGAGVALAGLAAYGLYKSNVINAVITSSIGMGSKALGKTKNDINLDTVKNMNPTKNLTNCLHTSTGYIMESVFGMKCTALADYKVDEVSGMVFEKGGRYLDSLNGAFNNLKINKYFDPTKSVYSFKSLPTVSKAIKDIPKGSTGIINLVSSNDGSHFINYEKTQKGIVTFIDCQDGTIYNPFQLSKSIRVSQFADFSQAIIREDADNVLKHMIKY